MSLAFLAVAFRDKDWWWPIELECVVDIPQGFIIGVRRLRVTCVLDPAWVCQRLLDMQERERAQSPYAES